MGKKTKSKQRLDTYYHYAKLQGYRSRAAYKLIQLNKKYNFLPNAHTLVDLCAAPGGWMQVARELMPLDGLVVGVDLDIIKKVPGTVSFQGDITTKVCYDRLRTEIKGRKCDVVLNDGAPNVGANWSKDAYTQSQLVLAAFKLAASFLREGGCFITKVFRSGDFQSLMWVFRKFFKQVDATKPKASRLSSAEIFVVCLGYTAPQFIDEKFFDPKHVFKDTEADHFQAQLAGEITSIDKLLTERRSRGGYDSSMPMHMFKTISLTDFIASQNALLTFAEFSKITISTSQRKRFFGIVKNQPADLDHLFEDIKVLGKRQIASILKWRSKVKLAHRKKQAEIEAEKEIQQLEEDVSSAVRGIPETEGAEDQSGDDSDEELQQELLDQQKRRLREARLKEQKHKEEIVRAETANLHHHDQDDQLGEDMEEMFPDNMEELDYLEPKEEDASNKSNQGPKYVKYSQEELEKNLEEIYQTRKAVRETRAQEMRDAKQQRKDRNQQRNKVKTQKLNPRLFAHRAEMEDEEEQAYMEAEEVNHNRRTARSKAEEVVFSNPLSALGGDDIFISDEKMPRVRGPIDPNEQFSDELSDAEAVIAKPVSDMEQRRKLLQKAEKKKQKKLSKSVAEGEDTGGEIEIVKERRMEDYNIDNLAETLAIAKKMLRSGSREEIINSSYNRFSYEDHDQLPKWFAEDQKKHSFKKEPISKEEYLQEKERLMAINARVPKKILEAKVRRKIRIQKKLKKTQKLAETVMNQDGVDEFSKLRQVRRMYDKSKNQLKDTKKYLVARKGKAGPPGKNNRKVKHVDSRMKKDQRSQRISKTRHKHRKQKTQGKF